MSKQKYLQKHFEYIHSLIMSIIFKTLDLNNNNLIMLISQEFFYQKFINNRSQRVERLYKNKSYSLILEQKLLIFLGRLVICNYVKILWLEIYESTLKKAKTQFNYLFDFLILICVDNLSITILKIIVFYQKCILYLIFIIIKVKDMLHYQSDDDFIGVFKEKNYTIQKDYIDTEQKYVRLYHTKYTPENPHSSICIIHGFGQHSKRFSQIADFYANNGFEALLIDLRGFGFSGAPRGTATVDQMQNDVIHLLKYARRDLPLYLYGHSMGGLVIIKLLMDKPNLSIAGCIITSPLLGFPKDRQLPWIKVVLLRLVGQKMQDFVINSMVNPTALTKNSKYIHNIFEDRLMIPFLSVKMAKSLIQTIQQVNKRSAQFKCPSILFHGKLDTITRYQDTQRFCYEHAMPYKKLYTFEQGFHQLQHDKQREQLLKKTLQFINLLPTKPKFQNFDTTLIKPKKSFPIFQYLLIGIMILLFILKKIKKVSIRNWIKTILKKN